MKIEQIVLKVLHALNFGTSDPHPIRPYQVYRYLKSLPMDYSGKQAGQTPPTIPTKPTKKRFGLRQTTFSANSSKELPQDKGLVD
jgi:hypothetical protein